MGKQRGHKSRAAGVPSAQSVNPLGNSPDDKEAGEVISEGNERAKKVSRRK